MSVETKKIRQFKCNSCGGELELHNQRTRYVSCPYCGSVADASNDAFQVLAQNENPEHFKPRSFLKIGLTGKIKDKTYKIIGRTAWQSNYKEYWAEDGETGYSAETWTFDEWLLINEDGTYLTIIEDDEGYGYAYSMTPKFPSLPSGTRSNDFYDNNSQQVTEYGKSRIMYFEGESTYLVKPGNEVGFSQYSTSGTDYISEWRYNQDGSIKEIEFSFEVNASADEIMKAFVGDEQISKIIKKKEKSKSTKKLNKRIIFFVGLINIFIGIFLSLYYPSSNYGHPVYETKFTLSDTTDKAGWYVVNDSVKAYSFTDLNTIKIKESDRKIRLNFVPKTLTDSFQCMYKIEIINKNKNVIYEHSIFNYHYKFYNDTTHEANREDYLFYEKYDLNNKKSDNFTVKVTFELPKKYNIPAKKRIGATVRISTASGEKNIGVAFALGFLLMIISFFIKKK